MAQRHETSIKDEIQALKRERIIEAARQLFFDRGYQGTTLDAVAERLNVTKPFIYSYFDSKAELLGEICQRGTRYSVACIDSALAFEGPPSEKLAHMIFNLCQVIYEHQANVAVFFREEKHLPENAARTIAVLRGEFDRKLTGLLKQGISTGEFHLGDPNVASLAIGGMVSWMYTWYRPHGRLKEDELSFNMTELVLRTVGADPAAAASRRARVTVAVAGGR